MAMNGPSLHLSWTELACWDRSKQPWIMVAPYPREWEERAALLAEAFEEIRHRAGDLPITVASAYRTPEHNHKVGGAENSQHVEGRALDLAVPEHLNTHAFWSICRDVSRILPIRGLGEYPNLAIVHIDVRPSACLHVWIDYKRPQRYR